MTGPSPTLLPVRWWRLRPWSSSALMRGGDRLEALLILVAALLLVGVLVPISAAYGTDTHTRLQQQAALTAATTHPVAAVLLADATPTVPVRGAMPQLSATGDEPTAKARWMAAGIEHTGRVPTTPGATAGQTVTVLVDATGTLAAKVHSGPDTAAAAVATGCGLWVLGAGATALTLTGVHRIFMARRLRAWARAWDDYDDGPHPR